MEPGTCQLLDPRADVSAGEPEPLGDLFQRRPVLQQGDQLLHLDAEQPCEVLQRHRNVRLHVVVPERLTQPLGDVLREARDDELRRLGRKVA